MKLQRKNDFWSLYKETIIKIGIMLSVVVPSVVLFYWGDKLNYVLIGKWLYYTGLGVFGIVFIYFLYDFVYFLLLQRNIPLTKEELEDAGINSPTEYKQFLYGYLRHYKIRNKSVMRLCRRSIFVSLYTPKERQAYFADHLDVTYRKIERQIKETTLSFKLKDNSWDWIDKEIECGTLKCTLNNDINDHHGIFKRHPYYIVLFGSSFAPLIFLGKLIYSWGLPEWLSNLAPNGSPFDIGVILALIACAFMFVHVTITFFFD